MTESPYHNPRPTSLAARLMISLVKLYQRALAPLIPPLCRFQPGCSLYAVEALETHGCVRGGALTLWRVLRCNPFSRGGHDPVPPRPKHPTSL